MVIYLAIKKKKYYNLSVIFERLIKTISVPNQLKISYRKHCPKAFSNPEKVMEILKYIGQIRTK